MAEMVGARPWLNPFRRRVCRLCGQLRLPEHDLSTSSAHGRRDLAHRPSPFAMDEIRSPAGATAGHGHPDLELAVKAHGQGQATAA